MDKVVDGKINTYKAAGWIGNIHKAVMTGLKECSTYQYKVGSVLDGKTVSYAKTYTFKTFCPTQDKIRYAVLGDMDFSDASKYTRQRVLAKVKAGEIDVIVHNGDIGYADGFEPHWDLFMNMMEEALATVPFMVTPGNHEFWYNFAAYKARFFMSDQIAEQHKQDKSFGKGDNMYYKWTYGRTAFVAMDSETAIDTEDFHKENLKFADKAFAEVDRKKTPLLVSHFHRPLYCSNDGECTKTADKPNKLTKLGEEMFKTHQVNLVLGGHVHCYERTTPMYKAKKVDSIMDAPVYIVQGASGNREGNKGGFSPPDQLPDWSAGRSTDVGYGMLTVDNKVAEGQKTHVKWQFYSAEKDEVQDSYDVDL
jgi:3',5'-cyclic AMP phosphodiesterase CpdA